MTGKGPHHDKGRGRTPGRVTAIIQQGVDITEGQGPVIFDTSANMEAGGLARRGGLKFFFATEDHLDRTTGFLGQEYGNGLKGIDIQFRAKGTAHWGLDNPDITGMHAK